MLGLNGIRNVSFGSLYTVNERGLLTDKQCEIEDKVNDVFETRFKQNGNNDGIPRTLSEMLTEDMAMDVELTHKKNGNVSLKLVDAEGIWLSAASKVVKNKDKIGITLNKNMSIVAVRKALNDFAKRCRQLAKFYDVEIPNLLAAKSYNEDRKIKTEKELAMQRAREAELARLEEEDRFIEEFGTDRFN